MSLMSLMKITLWSLLLCVSSVSIAGVSLDKRRLVFHGDKRSEQLTIRNSDSGIYLVQTQILQADGKTPSRDFMVMPPLFRLEANGSNVVRLSRIAGNFPLDRESLAYVVVKAIPGSNKPFAGGSSVAIAIATQIKLFFRPAHLKATLASSYAGLQFSQHEGVLTVKNPSPYYLTFNRLLLDGQDVDFRHAPQMIAPFSQVSYTHPGVVEQVQWQWIDDFGGTSTRYQWDRATQTGKTS